MSLSSSIIRTYGGWEPSPIVSPTITKSTEITTHSYGTPPPLLQHAIWDFSIEQYYHYGIISIRRSTYISTGSGGRKLLLEFDWMNDLDVIGQLWLDRMAGTDKDQPDPPSGRGASTLSAMNWSRLRVINRKIKMGSRESIRATASHFGSVTGLICEEI